MPMYPDNSGKEPLPNSKSATEFLLKWTQAVRNERLHNPEAYIMGEPGLYIGGLKVRPEDTIVTDNHGLPQIIRADCCE
jgi:hypothetical protein